jgi:hypothetical protein
VCVCERERESERGGDVEWVCKHSNIPNTHEGGEWLGWAYAMF